MTIEFNQNDKLPVRKTRSGRNRFQKLQWDSMFKALEAFKRLNGNMRVPSRDPSLKALWYWINTQRVWKRKGWLPDDAILRLQALGFEWAPVLKHREARMIAVNAAAAKAKNDGSSIWSHLSAEDASWLLGQLKKLKKGQLDSTTMQLLGDCNVRGQRDEHWQSRFDELQELYSSGVQYVPAKWPQNQNLADWIRWQLKMEAAGKLRADRREKLKTIGFFVTQCKTRRRRRNTRIKRTPGKDRGVARHVLSTRVSDSIFAALQHKAGVSGASPSKIIRDAVAEQFQDSVQQATLPENHRQPPERTEEQSKSMFSPLIRGAWKFFQNIKAKAKGSINS